MISGIAASIQTIAAAISACAAPATRPDGPQGTPRDAVTRKNTPSTPNRTIWVHSPALPYQVQVMTTIAALISRCASSAVRWAAERRSETAAAQRASA